MRVLGLEMVLRWLLLLRGSSSDLNDPGPYIHWCKPTDLEEGDETKWGQI